MKRIIILSTVLVLLAVSILYARQAITNQETMQSLAKVVRIKGYSCDTCVSAYFYGKKHRGKEFRVVCDAEWNAFRVTLASYGFIVEPW